MDWKNNIIADEAARNSASGMAELFTESFLAEKSNKGTFKRAMKDLDGIGKTEVLAAEGGITVKLGDAEAYVSKKFDACKCSCAAKTICRHIIAAAAVGAAIGNASPVEAEESSEAEIIKSEKPVKAVVEPEPVDKAYLSEVITTTEAVIDKGIVNCSETDRELLLRLSLRADSEYRIIANMCRNLAEEIALMNRKSADFSQISSAYLLARLYNTAQVMTRDCGRELMRKNEYSGEGNGSFICFGIYPRHSKSGYAGVTAVCYETRRQQFYTYNVSRPDFYKSTEKIGSLKQLSRLATMQSHWQDNTSLQHISGKNFFLFNFKADERRRISSSKQTSCLIGEEISAEKLGAELYKLPPHVEYDYFLADKAERFFLVKSPAFVNVSYSESAQTLFGEINGENAEKLPFEISYSEISEAAVRYIEGSRDYPMNNRLLLVRCAERKFVPVSFVDVGTVRNFWFREEMK